MLRIKWLLVAENELRWEALFEGKWVHFGRKCSSVFSFPLPSWKQEQSRKPCTNSCCKSWFYCMFSGCSLLQKHTKILQYFSFVAWLEHADKCDTRGRFLQEIPPDFYLTLHLSVPLNLPADGQLWSGFYFSLITLQRSRIFSLSSERGYGCLIKRYPPPFRETFSFKKNSVSFPTGVTIFACLLPLGL